MKILIALCMLVALLAVGCQEPQKVETPYTGVKSSKPMVNYEKPADPVELPQKEGVINLSGTTVANAINAGANLVSCMSREQRDRYVADPNSPLGALYFEKLAIDENGRVAIKWANRPAGMETVYLIFEKSETVKDASGKDVVTLSPVDPTTPWTARMEQDPLVVAEQDARERLMKELESMPAQVAVMTAKFMQAVERLDNAIKDNDMKYDARFKPLEAEVSRQGTAIAALTKELGAKWNDLKAWIGALKAQNPSLKIPDLELAPAEVPSKGN